MHDDGKILENERLLFRRMAEGDEAAFETIFHHYNQHLYPFLLSKTKSHETAEELIQEIFLKLWDKRASLEHIENYRSYIFRMGVNMAYNNLKRAAFEEQVQKQLWNGVTQFRNNTEELVEVNETQRIINEAVDRLPAAQRKIYLLSREQGLNHEEIAAELNISKRTVSNQITSALHSIREHLQNHPGISISILMIILKNFRN